MTKSTAAYVWLTLLLFFSSCAPNRIGPLGGNFSAAPILTLGEFHALDETADGRRVRVSGRVTRVCQHMGCWFYVSDEQSEIFVDLEMGKLFIIPQSARGRTADVEGMVKFSERKPYLVGKVLELH